MKWVMYRFNEGFNFALDFSADKENVLRTFLEKEVITAMLLWPGINPVLATQE